jgi:hypothetical protein
LNSYPISMSAQTCPPRGAPLPRRYLKPPRFSTRGYSDRGGMFDNRPRLGLSAHGAWNGGCLAHSPSRRGTHHSQRRILDTSQVPENRNIGLRARRRQDLEISSGPPSLSRCFLNPKYLGGTNLTSQRGLMTLLL